MASMAFPVRLSNKGFAVSQGAQRIRESVLIILGTEKGSRVMRPDFGSRLHTLFYRPRTRRTEEQIVFYVEEALAAWEPRIDQVVVATLPGRDGTELMVEVRYRLRDASLERDSGFWQVPEERSKEDSLPRGLTDFVRFSIPVSP